MPTMGQLFHTLRSFAYRGSQNEQVAEEFHHHQGDCSLYLHIFLHSSSIYVQEALQRHTARQLRLAFMSQPWHGRMDFKEAAMQEVRSKEALFNVSNTLQNVERANFSLRTSSPMSKL